MLWKTPHAPTNDHAGNQPTTKHYQPHSNPPKIRTIGLGVQLIQETLPQAGTPYVELIAVMTKYSPFAEKAGMKKVIEEQSIDSTRKVSKMLSELGFNLQLLGSEQYVTRKLESLSAERICWLKETFIHCNHPRFKREFAVSRHQPFGKTSDYCVSIQNAGVPKIAKLVKLVGMLLQTKVYFFGQALKLFKKRKKEIMVTTLFRKQATYEATNR